MENEAIADEAVVDEDVDGVSVELLQFRLGDEARDAEETGVGRLVVGFALPGRGSGRPARVKSSSAVVGSIRAEVSRPKIWKRRSALEATAGAMSRAWVWE